MKLQYVTRPHILDLEWFLFYLYMKEYKYVVTYCCTVQMRYHHRCSIQFAGFKLSHNLLTVQNVSSMAAIDSVTELSSILDQWDVVSDSGGDPKPLLRRYVFFCAT